MLSNKVQEVLQKLTIPEKENIRRMDAFLKHDFVTEKFGNKSERFGIKFSLYPLWVKEVLDELARE